jgi:hypothetical protein
LELDLAKKRQSRRLKSSIALVLSKSLAKLLGKQRLKHSMNFKKKCKKSNQTRKCLKLQLNL